MGTTFQKKFGREGTFVGTLIGYDSIEDLYKIQYEDKNEEEMTWPDLNKLLRTSGDSITAPHACPPAFEEQPIRMSPAAALASQRNIMSSRVYGLQVGNVGANTLPSDFDTRMNCAW